MSKKHAKLPRVQRGNTKTLVQLTFNYIKDLDKDSPFKKSAEVSALGGGGGGGNYLYMT